MRFMLGVHRGAWRGEKRDAHKGVHRVHGGV